MIVGKVLGSPDEQFEVDMSSSRRILVCGKTGTGKSYTLGVLIEELALDSSLVCIVVDPQGIFWTMGQANYSQHEALSEWGIMPRALSVNLLVPGDPEERYGGADVIMELKKRNVSIRQFKINPSDMSEEMWCDLFSLSINELQGSTLFKCVRLARKKMGRDFFIPDLIAEVASSSAVEATKEALFRKMEMASDWGIFNESSYTELWDFLEFTGVNVLDLSTLDQTRYGLRNLVVCVLARYLFRQRTLARRREELSLSSAMPRVWLALDEAHNFCPSGSSSLSKEVLIRWAKEGRQPGLSLVVATQQPSAVDKEILTQCDLVIAHKLTNRDDRGAVVSLAQDYTDRTIIGLMSAVESVGQAVVIDDKKGSVAAVRIRPRLTQHGGGSR